MRRFFVDKQQLQAGILDGDEFNHLKNVLRMKEGDNFIALCNDEYDYFCEIVSISKNNASFKVLEKSKNNANPKLNITLVQALAKGEKLDLITQKASEIGASKIVPMYFERCDVKPNTTKVSRLGKIAISASKQCGRSTIIEIGDCTTIKNLKEIIDANELTVFANVSENSLSLGNTLKAHPNAQNIAIIVGPEGGFTPLEIEKIIELGAVSVTLGTRVLRTETAGLYALSVISDFYNN